MPQKKLKYPVELISGPGWPTEMKCEECRFHGWKWMGITKLMFNLLSSDRTWRKCSKCGVGLLDMSGDILPVFILKN